MSLAISVTREAQHTRVSLKGSATLGQVLSLLQVLQVDSQQWPRDEALLDLSGLDRRFSVEDQVTVQAEAGRCLSCIPRVLVRWGRA